MRSLVYFSFSTNNTSRFVRKIKNKNEKVEIIEIPFDDPTISIENDYIIVIPSYEEHVFPELYDLFEDFFETKDNIEKCKGIFAGGNRNFMSLFGVTAKHFSKKYNIPILHYFEFQGTNHDVDKIIEELTIE